MIAEPAGLLRKHDCERMLTDLLDTAQPTKTRSGFGDRRTERTGQQADDSVQEEAVRRHVAVGSRSTPANSSPDAPTRKDSRNPMMASRRDHP